MSFIFKFKGIYEEISMWFQWVFKILLFCCQFRIEIHSCTPFKDNYSNTIIIDMYLCNADRLRKREQFADTLGFEQHTILISFYRRKWIWMKWKRRTFRTQCCLQQKHVLLAMTYFKWKRANSMNSLLSSLTLDHILAILILFYPFLSLSHLCRLFFLL